MPRTFATFAIFLFVLLSAMESSAQPIPDVGATHASPLPNEKPTIAVTTFENLSAYPENAWVAMSFSESLTTKLKKLYERFRLVERIRIYDVIRERGLDPEAVSKTPLSQQQELGTLLGAQYLILGSVSLSGSADELSTPLLANVRMVDVQTGEIKEAESIKGQMQQLFDLEIKLAYALLKQMGIELNPQEAEKLNLKETLSILANKYYSLGQKAFYEGDYEMAKNLYDKAIEVVGGIYYQQAELSLIATLERQKSVADEAQKSKIKAEALRRREESERKRAEADQRLFAEARYSMLAEDYKTAVERYQQYLDLAKPFRQIKWKRELDNKSQITYQPLMHENTIYAALLYHSGDYRKFYLLEAIDTKTGELRWQFKNEKELRSTETSKRLKKSPIVIVEGTLYAPVDNNHLVALDSTTGKLLWEFKREIPWNFRQGMRKYLWVEYDDWPFPQVMDGTVYVKFYDGMLAALSAKTGEIKWQFDTGIRSVRSVLVSNGRVYLGFRDGLIALSGENGEEIWHVKIDGSFTLPLPWRYLSLTDKTDIERYKLDKSGVLIRGNIGRNLELELEYEDLILEVDGTSTLDYEQFVAAIRSKKNPTTRTLKILREGKEKTLTIEETDELLPELSPPIIQFDEDILYVKVSRMYEIIYALKASNGERLWEYQASPMRGFDELVVKEKRLYAYSFDTLYVLRTDKNELLWKTTGGLLLAKDRVYWTGSEEMVSCLSSDTGEVIWQTKPLREEIQDLIAATDTTVYLYLESLGSFLGLTPSDRNIYAISAETGEELWQLPIGGSPQHVLIGEEEGTLYLTTDRLLYAVNPKSKGMLPEQEEYESLLGIGTALVALERYAEAIPKLKEALELRVDLIEDHWQLALALEGINKWDEAAKERNEYLWGTNFDSARPEVKKRLYERFGIQKWILDEEPEFDIRQYASEIEPALRWGGEISPTVVEGIIHDVREHVYHNGLSIRSEDWGNMEVIGPKAIKYMRDSKRWGSFMPWGESLAQRFSDSGQIYIVSTLLDETVGGENGTKTFILGSFSEETGKLLWKFQTKRSDSPIRKVFSILLVSDRVYWGVEGRLYALDKNTGTLQWEFYDETTPQLFSYPSIGPRRYFGSGHGSGPKVGMKFTFLVSADTLVYIVDSELIFAVSAQTGKLMWKKSIPNLRKSVKIREGRVYIISSDSSERETGKLYVLRADTGEVDWMIEMESRVIPYECELDKERIYLRTSHGLQVFSAETGKLQWEFRSSIKENNQESDVYGRIYGIVRGTGGAGGWGDSSRPEEQKNIVVGENDVYLRGSTFYALDKSSGKVKWGIEGLGPHYSYISGVETAGAKHEGEAFETNASPLLYLYSHNPAILYVFDLAQIERLRAEGKQWWSDAK